MGRSLLPTADRVVVRVQERKGESGIVIPETAKEKPQEGVVVAVGPGRVGYKGLRISSDLNVGDYVYFSKYGGTEITVGDAKYIILRDDDILAKIMEA